MLHGDQHPGLGVCADLGWAGLVQQDAPKSFIDGSDFGDAINSNL